MVRSSRLIATAALLVVLLAPSGLLAYPRDDAALVGVSAPSRLDIQKLNDLGMDIVTVNEGVAEVAATPDEIEILWANGFRPNIILSDMRAEVASLALADRGAYHSYSELTTDLASWADAYPSITELISIGTSHQGRELWALKISDNAGLQEPEPEVQWIGGHHGNETISVEVCYYMALYLLEGYGTDPQVTWLVNEREIWIIPMLNPDGHTVGSRYNAQGTDLNRDYLCPCGCNASAAFSAPETRALRDFNVGMNPVTSLTFHSGAVYVNYLWDHTYTPTPDEPMLIGLSDVYSSYSGYPATNGADWYIAHGTCQDWCYDTRGEVDTTIEVSVIKDPPASQIDSIVGYNIPAMLHQARMSGRGIRGLVTDLYTGLPLAATISIPEIGRDVYTDPDVGDYHRMLESGTYTVVCSVDGYPAQTAYNVSASLDTFTVVDFAMTVERGAIAGYVRDTTGAPLEAVVELTDLSGYSTISDSLSGYYEITGVPIGDRSVGARRLGYSSDGESGVAVSQGTLTSADFVLEEALFYDDMESGAVLWAGEWGQTSESACSPLTSLTDSPGVDYSNDAYAVLTLLNPVDLSGSESGALVFWHRYTTESGYDYCHVDVTSGGGWTRIASYSGLLESWSEVALDVTDYVGTDSFNVRFVLDSDGLVQGDGWYVDDVHVFADSPDTGIGDGDAVAFAPSVRNAPNPFIARTTLRYTVPKRAAVDIRVYDVSGRLVATLLESAEHGPGEYATGWDGLTDGGRTAAPGVYFAWMSTGGESVTGKMVLLK